MNDYTAILKDLNLKNFSEKDIFTQLFNFAVDNDYSLALWKLPREHKKKLIISRSCEKVDADLENLKSGFVFTPFNTNEKENSIFLNADVIYSTGDHQLKINTNDSEFNINKISKAFENKNQKLSPFYYNDISSYQITSADDYQEMVKQAVCEINKGHFMKVVPSRNKLVELPRSFHLVELFNQLCETYPEAFISLVTVKNIGTWIGASPEILIKTTADNFFYTSAVAGTQIYNSGQPLSEVGWTQKEIEEQAIVSRYIINCFKKIRLREFEEYGPKTYRAGNLTHLKTDFKVDMKATNFPQLGTVMLKLLHPTSAVCGMPKEEALNFLNQYENYDREYYSGFLGPVNIDNETNIYVNIRCMQLLDKKAIVYAGAGVTYDSVPAKEWQETEMKCNTLLDVIYQ